MWKRHPGIGLNNWQCTLQVCLRVKSRKLRGRGHLAPTWASPYIGSTISQDIMGRHSAPTWASPDIESTTSQDIMGEDIQPRHISASTFFKFRKNPSQPLHSLYILKFNKNPSQPLHPAPTFLKFEKNPFQPRHSLYIVKFSNNPSQPLHPAPTQPLHT